MKRILLLSMIPRDLLFAAWMPVQGESIRTRARNMMLALVYKIPEPESRHLKLKEMGRLVGLDASETDLATQPPRSKRMLCWFWIILICIGIGVLLAPAIAMAYARITGQYIPGTLYASIGPNDHRRLAHVVW